MRRGWMIVNTSVTNRKFIELYQMFVDAAKQMKCGLEIKTNAEILFMIGSNKKADLKEIDFVLFWDKDILLARMLEELGVRIFNSAEAIEKCDDKAYTYLALKNHSIQMPKTYLAPKVFPNGHTPDYEYYEKIADELNYPFIMKENRGSFGFQVYLIENREELRNRILLLGATPFIMQEFIAFSKGRDIRIQVVGDEVVACVLRENASDFRANVTNGGHMVPYEASEQQKQMALEVRRILALDFC